MCTFQILAAYVEMEREPGRKNGFVGTTHKEGQKRG